jgi:GTP-binding protein Era
MSNDQFRAGFVALVGRPNTGKSSLLNALVGEKISIVTAKPQTTRQSILGIYTNERMQIVFVDTPGLHARSGKLIDRAMSRASSAAMVDADLILLVIEATGWTRGDSFALERVENSNAPTLLVINKTDRIKPREKLLPFLQACSERGSFADLIPVSARRPENLQRLLEVIHGHLPTGPCLFPAGVRTDRKPEFRVGEVLREKLLMALREEVPYGLAIEIAALEEQDRVTMVDAVIWVEKESHKGIVIGSRGDQLKQVGRAARLDLERTFNRRFYLETRVKVKENWSDNARALRQLGFEFGG